MLVKVSRQGAAEGGCWSPPNGGRKTCLADGCEIEAAFWNGDWWGISDVAQPIQAVGLGPAILNNTAMGGARGLLPVS